MYAYLQYLYSYLENNGLHLLLVRGLEEFIYKEAQKAKLWLGSYALLKLPSCCKSLYS